jgi:para-nitrobenzyl esterase
VRDATVFGKIAPQPDIRADARARWGDLLDLIYPGAGNPLEGRAAGEDCLVLNVWTQGFDSPKRPVMVWFHGGAFVHGAGSETMFHGERLVAQEDIVLVTVNHRLGILGYTALGETCGEEFDGSGVVGMLDAVAALRWVRDNVEAFGGDPANVTIFGQSGGGCKVSTLLAMPDACGLFRKAIVQAGPGLRVTDQARGQELASDLLSAFDLQPTKAGKLQELPLDQILAYQRELTQRSGLFGGGMLIAPVIDDTHLPRQPFDPVAPAISVGVPLLIGTNTDEAAMFLTEDPSYRTDITSQDVRERLKDTLDDAADRVVSHYEAAHPELPPHRVLSRILSDVSLRLPSIRLAERKLDGGSAPVYMYLFTYGTEVLNGLLGSCHSLELPFVFSTVDRIPFAGDRPERFEVAKTMGRVWASFARTGSPGPVGMPSWPPYETSSRSTMLLGLDPEIQRDPDRGDLAMLEGTHSPFFE